MDISYSTTRIAHYGTLIPILPADLGAQHRLAPVVLLVAPILANLVEALTTRAGASHASIHARLCPDARCAHIILHVAVVYALLGFGCPSSLIAAICALRPVSHACLRTEHWHTLVIVGVA